MLNEETPGIRLPGGGLHNMRIDKKNRNILLIILAALAVALVLSLIFGADSLGGHAEDAFPVYINEIMASNATYPNEDGVRLDRAI